MRLLTPPDANTKIRKNRILTYGLSLAPHRMGGPETVCPSSTAGCRSTCLVFSGRARIFPQVIISRVQKTQFFWADRPGFIRQLNREIGQAIRLNGRKKIAFRLNVFSDIAWESLSGSPIAAFPKTTFYDYTKIDTRYRQYLEGNFPANYSLTFSRSEENESTCLDFLRQGGTVSLVTAGDALRGWYRGYPIVSGDATDYRPDDPVGHWIGLRVKGSQKTKVTKRSNFAV